MVGGGTNTGYNDTVETAFTEGGRVVCQYIITPGTDTIVPGTDDTGNHCYDCDTLVSLPFPFQLYDQTYNSLNVSSNGRLDFVTVNDPGGYQSTCLPAPPGPAGPYDYTIFPLWSDLRTDIGLPGCQTVFKLGLVKMRKAQVIDLCHAQQLSATGAKAAFRNDAEHVREFPTNALGNP